MRVLMMTTPVPTHFTPLIPLAWALRAAGHELLVAGQPDVMATARSAGLSAVSIADRFGIEKHMLNRLEGTQRPIEANPRSGPDELGDFGLVWVGQTKYVLPQYLAFAREFRPDLIVADPFEYSALAVAAALGVPSVHHRWGVDELSGPARVAVREPLREICRSIGLDGLPDPTVLLDPCPPALQLPDVEQGAPIRYVPFNGAAELPSWLREPVPVGTRRVAVSMGVRTLLLNGVPHVRRILHAFDGLPDVEVLATVEEDYREALGPVPANVRLIDPTPLDLFLGTCDAMVHHGGAGSAMAATAAGLPQLVLPQLADQFGHGDRLAAVGAAVTLDTAETQDDPRLLREAVEAVLFEPAYAKAAQELRDDRARMPSPARVVEDLERLVAGYGEEG